MLNHHFLLVSHLLHFASQVHLEETVAAQLKQEKADQVQAAQASSPAPSKSRSQPATPNTKTREAVSTESRADYTCYTIRSSNTREVISVVIEAKMDKRATHAVAQVRGVTSFWCLS